MKLHRYVDHQRLHIVTKDVISLSISVLLLFRHYISHKITFGAPSSGGVLRSACGAFISYFRDILFLYFHLDKGHCLAETGRSPIYNKVRNGCRWLCILFSLLSYTNTNNVTM